MRAVSGERPLATASSLVPMSMFERPGGHAGVTMPLEPEEIQGHQFRAAFLGYDIKHVHHFMARVARDFQLLLDAVTQVTASGKHAGLLNSVGAPVLARATEEAESILASVRKDAEKTKEEARAQARRIREQAGQEAAAIKEEAQERAAELLEEAHALLTRAQRDIESLKASQHEEVNRIRRDALQETEAIVAAARDRAASLLQEAELYARGIMTDAQRDYDEQFQRTARRLAEMEVFQQALAVNVFDSEELLRVLGRRLTAIKKLKPSTREALEQAVESVPVAQETEGDGLPNEPREHRDAPASS